ncbi:chalcone isomerase family protein [Shewanella sp. VB17]|uniref:chalcone isomerase family protein n=1 Tax=Shewanella sp. VB17 TaxID=2739432 RepID=UPI001563FF3C|nr:chalcone isomerase family protein [Shewanella sp. VB17]NRD74257.1 chalcone isomerase family protein [Shewanella sp. VB17]
MKIPMLCFLLMSYALNANPLPQMTKLGEGEMRYLFWTLYRAELYVDASPYQQDHYPKLLKIEYFKNISQADLLNATKEQWQHIGIDERLITDWLEQLNRIWPNINEGDQLIIYVDDERRSTFYSGGHDLPDQELGVINDDNFGPAFLDIWLSEKTSEPQLRMKLLGERE